MEQHLQELDARLGAIPVLSLTQRGLLPGPGAGVRADGSGSELADRIAGALVGAACGSALGLPYEWRRMSGAVADPRAGTRYSADVQMLARSAELQTDLDLEAAPALAEWLSEEPRLRNPGNAIPAVIDRLQVGMPWYEAGVGSFGAGALVRAVASGLVYRDRPEWRPIAAALDTVVTHATVDAVAAAGTVADLIAEILMIPVGSVEPIELLEAVLARSQSPSVVSALVFARDGIRNRRPPRSRADALGSLAAALYWALPNLRAPEIAIRGAVQAGGDTDTVGALVGAFVGAASGLHALPSRWIRSVRDIEPLLALATRIAGAEPTPGPAVPDTEETAGVHISFLLDRSGSMQGLESDVVGGFNGFVTSQKKGTGECALTLAQFDTEDPFEVLIDDTDIRTVVLLDGSAYEPRGATPLYDAIGSLLDHAAAIDDARRAEAKLARDHVVVVFTDGHENASRRWTQAAIFDRIEDLKAKGWTFVFLGANQDSYQAGRAFGIDDGSVSNFAASPHGVELAFASVDRASHSFRGKTRSGRLRQRDGFFEGVKEGES